METESWQNYLLTAETKLNELTIDQIATCAKIIALELGSYRVKFGDSELESFDKYVSVDQLDDEGQEIFKSGMEALLAVIRQVEIVEAGKEIKKH